MIRLPPAADKVERARRVVRLANISLILSIVLLILLVTCLNVVYTSATMLFSRDIIRYAEYNALTSLTDFNSVSFLIVLTLILSIVLVVVVRALRGMLSRGEYYSSLKTFAIGISLAILTTTLCSIALYRLVVLLNCKAYLATCILGLSLADSALVISILALALLNARKLVHPLRTRA